MRKNNVQASQRVYSESFIEEGAGDFYDAMHDMATTEIFAQIDAGLVLLRSSYDLLVLRRTIKAMQMALRRLEEALKRAVPPEGQEVLRP